jgi:hypothetical protein
VTAIVCQLYSFCCMFSRIHDAKGSENHCSIEAVRPISQLLSSQMPYSDSCHDPPHVCPHSGGVGCRLRVQHRLPPVGRCVVGAKSSLRRVKLVRRARSGAGNSGRNRHLDRGADKPTRFHVAMWVAPGSDQESAGRETVLQACSAMSTPFFQRNYSTIDYHQLLSTASPHLLPFSSLLLTATSPPLVTSIRHVDLAEQDHRFRRLGRHEQVDHGRPADHHRRRRASAVSGRAITTRNQHRRWKGRNTKQPIASGE